MHDILGNGILTNGERHRIDVQMLLNLLNAEFWISLPPPQLRIFRSDTPREYPLNLISRLIYLICINVKI